jgi:hypothetical protein
LATTKLPRYVRPKPLASGKTAYFWELPHWAKGKAREGVPCPLESQPLGTDLGEMQRRADFLNEALDGWRKGESKTSVGSVKWLFAWYRDQAKYKDKRFKTRKDYRVAMELVEAIPMRLGTFGERKASAVNAEIADKIYDKLRPRGERQASHAMSVCRLVWNWAKRHHDTTGITFNPFAEMALNTRPDKGNRPTSRAEYDLYRETARAMGYQSMATAAALAFELCQRVWDVFGFVDEDGKKARGFVWPGYKEGDYIDVSQSKTGRSFKIPLVAKLAGETVHLYPELEAELAATKRHGILIVVKDSSKLPYKHRNMASIHRKICRKAGLPDDMTFTGFRHGGLTEIGDSGEADVRPISGHTQLNTTAIYNKASMEKARRIASIRRDHIEQMRENVGMECRNDENQKTGKGS